MSNASTINIDIKVDDKGAISTVKKFGGEVDAVGKKGTDSANSMGMSWKALASTLGGISLIAIGREILDVGMKVDSLQRSFSAVTGSTNAMIAEFDFLRSTANSTGQNMYALADSYLQLSASTQNTVLEGQKTRDLFTSMSEAASVLGLSTDKVELSLKAFAQMASKGTVQMEELKGQLGDSLPGALKIAAGAMGVSQKALTKMIESGDVLAGDLLPKMSEELHKLYGEAAATAALESGIAATNRLSQAWTDFKNNLYDNKAAVAAIDAIGTAVRFWADAVADITGKTNTISGIKEQLREEETLLKHNKTLLEDYQNSWIKSPATIAEYTKKVQEGEAAVLKLSESLKGVEQASDPAFQKNIENAKKATDTFVVLENMAGESYKAIEQAENERAKAYFENEDKIQGEAKRSADQQIREAERLADDRSRLAEHMTDILAKEGMTQTEQAKYELDKQYAEDMKVAGADIKLQQMVTAAYQIELKKRTKADNDYAAFAQKQHLAAAEKIKDGWQVAAEGREEADRIANERIEEQNTETTSIITEEWGRAMGSIQSYTVDLVMGAEFSFDTILDIFKRMLAEMLVAILASGIKQAFINMFDNNALTTAWGGMVSGISGAAGFGGGYGGGYGSFSGNENVAGAATSGWGKVGGGLMVAGGAYGMYSGAQNLKKGNVGAGALQLGLGGLSAYQGAVMLGIVEKGAFTAGMNALGAKIGLTVAPKVAATVAASVGAPSASLAAAESAYLAGSAPAAPALSAAPAAAPAAAGTPALATAAAYAVPALAAGLAIKGIIDKGNRPSASAEIDEYGVTPDNLKEFNDQLTATNGTILATVPTLQKYNAAIYDSETQILTLTNGTKQLQLQYDAADAAGHQWSSTLTGGTSIMTSAAGQIISSFAPLPLTVDQVHEASQLAGQAFEHMASGSELAGRSMNKLEGYLENLGMSEDQAASAAAQLVNNVEDLGGAAVAAAGAIGGSASEINRAFRSLESMSSENFDSSAYSSHLVGGDSNPSYHADGGIFTRQVRLGNHVFGDKLEGLYPLPEGPNTMGKIIDRLDRIESGNNKPQIIHNHFHVDGREIATTIMPAVDEHVAAKARAGQLANRTVYASR